MPLSISPRQVWKPLLLSAAVAFVYWGVLARLGLFWWQDENYSHGLLIPFVIGYILWAGRDTLAGARSPCRCCCSRWRYPFRPSSSTRLLFLSSSSRRAAPCG